MLHLLVLLVMCVCDVLIGLTMDLCVTFTSVYQAQSSSGVLLLSGKQKHQSSQPLHGREGGGGRGAEQSVVTGMMKEFVGFHFIHKHCITS